MLALKEFDHSQEGNNSTPEQQKADDDGSDDGGQNRPVPCLTRYTEGMGGAEAVLLDHATGGG